MKRAVRDIFPIRFTGTRECTQGTIRASRIVDLRAWSFIVAMTLLRHVTKAGHAN